MNEVNFVMRLKGWIELNGGAMPTEAQWKMIKDHLEEFFTKVTKPLEPESSQQPSEFDVNKWFRNIKPNNIDVAPLPYIPNDTYRNPYWLNETGVPPGTLYC